MRIWNITYFRETHINLKYSRLQPFTNRLQPFDSIGIRVSPTVKRKLKNREKNGHAKITKITLSTVKSKQNLGFSISELLNFRMEDMAERF